jgi:peptidylprolyl isomerase
MHFVGWLDTDGRKGKEIYNSRRERESVSFVVGTDRVMQGWSDGVIGMKPGGKRLLMLPPALGYGSKGVEGVIPPDARMIFVIDVMSIEKSPD